jgi:hypothetical protein
LCIDKDIKLNGEIMESLVIEFRKPASGLVGQPVASLEQQTLIREAEIVLHIEQQQAALENDLALREQEIRVALLPDFLRKARIAAGNYTGIIGGFALE